MSHPHAPFSPSDSRALQEPEEGPGVFGLPEHPEVAGVVIIPVPFDATTSYRPGTRFGPDAVRRASFQVDLDDARFGPVWRAGLFMEPTPPAILRLSEEARAAAAGVLRDHTNEDPASLAIVDAAGERVNTYVRERVTTALRRGQVPAVLGGEHSVAYASMLACAETGSIGVLHIDAHLDLRPAYLGMRWSHASVVRNAVEAAPDIDRVVSVGIRDASAEERAYAADHHERLRVFPQHQLDDQRYAGRTWSDLASEIIDALPRRVYITFDIDGLDPALCPRTGTPVPGGLAFEEVGHLLDLLAGSGRSIVGFDLVEVSPGHEPVERTDDQGDTIDAIVGARILYRLCGAAIRAREASASGA